MGVTIQAYDDLGTGLNMAGFKNGVGRLDLDGTSIGSFLVSRSKYDDWKIEGPGPYFADVWTGGPGGMAKVALVWRDAGPNVFVAHLAFADAQDDPTLVFANIDILVDDGLLDGREVRVSFMKGNDTVSGNRFADILKGGDGNDRLDGNAGNDRLFGERGNDTLTGDHGRDILSGGAGRDVFVFGNSGSGRFADRITDFNVIDDMIHLDNAVYRGLRTGTLSPAAFTANLTGQAADAGDRIIYETDTGRVFFDADGTGKAARVHVVTLNSSLFVTSADFLII
jgi:Ca2+-binding RTX toxin-like protein